MVNPRRSSLVASSSALLVLLVAAGAGRAGVRAPLAGEGDFGFSVDLPVFPTADGGRVDVAVMVYHPQLHFKGHPDGKYRAEAEVSVKLARQGLIAVDDTQRFLITADSETDALLATRFQLLETSYLVEPGRWAVTVRVRDRGREKSQTLPNPRLAEATGVLFVPPPQAGAVQLSDPEFRLGSLVNPERLYGVNQDTLEAYLELRGASAGRAYVVDVEVLDPIYGGMGRESIVLEASESKAATLYRLPLGTFPEGSYLLRLVPRWAPETGTEAEFSVSWRMDRVVQSARDLGVEALLMLEPEEMETFHRLSRPAQLRMMQDFWDRVDPTPGTTRNEVYDRFLERVAFAQRHYGDSTTPGPLTDRGRIYVRFGTPAEVSVEVVPLNADELDEAIGRVHDTYQMERPGSYTKESISRAPLRVYETRDNQDLVADRKRNLASVNREGAFELWQYNLQGAPLLPTYAGWPQNLDLRFLFVDRAGTGDYRLEFTNLPLHY